MRVDVCVIGAGIAGLAAAADLHATGLEVAVLEAAERPGGRARGVLVDGYAIAEGDHLLHNGWATLRRVTGPMGLELAEYPGGLCIHRTERRLRFSASPGRPYQAVTALRSPIGSAADKARIARLLYQLAASGAERALAGPEHACADSFDVRGYSADVVDQFLRPLLTGLAGDEDLTSSIRGADWLLRLLVRGRFAIPAAGTGALPDALAGQLPERALRLSTAARLVHTDRVMTDAGRINTRAVIVATDARAAVSLIPGLHEPRLRPITTFWHTADDAELPDPARIRAAVILDGLPGSPVARTAVVSRVARSLAPPGRALMATSVVGGDGKSLDSLDKTVRDRLKAIHRTDMNRWQTLDVRHSDHGLVTLRSPYNFSRPVRIIKGLYVCGDHRDLPNVEGALRSGRRAAAAVLDDFGHHPSDH